MSVATANEVLMPKLSDSMEKGTILSWLVATGTEVAAGQDLLEVETDKANMTYEADEEGVLKILAEEGSTLQVGEPIARIGEGSGGKASKDDDKSGDEDDAGKEPAAEKSDDENAGEEPAAEKSDEDEDETSDDAGDAQPAAEKSDDEDEESGDEDTDEDPDDRVV